MFKRLATCGLLATALLALSVPTPAALAAKSKRPGHAAAGSYINPFASPGWAPSRTDMGVDWIPTRPMPVLAIGDAVILGSDWHAPWPGGRFIYYQLLDGSHAGDIVYVAEHLRKLARPGTIVKAGQKIATALPGYPWTEWGWADQYGSPRAYPCYKEGRQTNSGKEMARFMISLGAGAGDPPGHGTNAPSGRLC